MSNTSSLADYLAELGVDVNNVQEFLLKLSQIISTKSDSVTLTQVLQDGTTKEFLVPSFGYLSNRVNNIEEKFNNLLSGNANQLGVKDADGNLKTFELKDISTVISDLEGVSLSGVAIPSTFNYKTNWFFESFLNPLLYINIDTSTLTTDTDINRFEATRIIVTSKVQTDLDYFDATYKGKNNLVYGAVIKDLQNRGIQYFEDTSELELPPAKSTVSGSFDVLAILEDTSSSVIAGQTLTEAIRKYRLNTLRYKSVTPNGTVEKILQVGDVLIGTNNSEYKIESVDSASRSVILTLKFGTGGLAQGAAQIRIKPTLERSRVVQLNLGYNERNIVFLRPISDRLAITTDSYSQGFAILTNELIITMNNGKQLSLTQFYQNFVSDFGLMFLNYAKEKKIPSALGEAPNGVTLATTNFKVVQTDQHIQDADNTLAIKQKVATKEQTIAQIREIDKQITATRANLNTNASLNESQRLKLQKDLTSFADSRLTLTKSQQSLISDITTSIKSTPSFITSPTYAVRGFWSMPAAKTTLHGTQSIAQFKVGYRTLSKTGSAKSADQIEFTDANGTKQTGAFSPWTEFLTKPRTKVYNDSTGFYDWADESISDPDQVNSNQLDVPIKKGEIVEIRIKSLSEAGWPDSPVESDWSDSIFVEFPKEIETAEDATIVAQQAFADEARVSFQEELTAQGLDIHLSTAFTTRDKYYAHKSEDVASGFFANDGNVISLYTKLKDISDTLASVQTAIATGRGVIKVSLIDQAGNQRNVINGETVEIFAGYYKDYIKDTSVTATQFIHGKVIATQYFIQIENTSQTPLQLISTLNGGIGETAPGSNDVANPTSNYHVNLRYDLSPLGLNSTLASTVSSFIQPDGYQSSQVKSQYIYSRFKDVKITGPLYSGDNIITTSTPPALPPIYRDAGTYNYRGVLVGNTLVPYSAGHYLPYDPTLTTAGGSLPSIRINGIDYPTVSNANIWNGTLDTNNAPVGNGLLTEFCIHKDHPLLKAGQQFNAPWTPNLFRPGYAAGDTTQKYLAFSQAIHCEISEAESQNVFGAAYYQQAEYVKPATVTIPTLSTAMKENQYPIKNGFKPTDEFLVGKYTCGAYLFLAPSSHTPVSVDGISPSGSYKPVEFGTSNSIKVPLVFQFRASDKLGYIGGYRANNPTGLKNVKYAKKLGIDIYTSDLAFSFDVFVRTQYEKETAVVTPVSAISSSTTPIQSFTN
jgi:hypothetical protein